MTQSNNKSSSKVKEIIELVGLPIRGSYRPGEVCKILGISQRSFHRMTREYERDPLTGSPRNPATLDSFWTRGQRRVLINELIDFLTRNNAYDRVSGMDKASFTRQS